MSSNPNIFPVFDKIVDRQQKETKLNQRSCVIWMTGLSGSGKTTIALALEKMLFEKGYFTQILDGDNVRVGINNNLGFSDDDRKENIRRIAEVSKLFLNAGIITICCFVSPLEEQRALAKKIIGDKDFIEVFINTPISVCEQRDVKGLYKKARAGEIKDFTGITSAFEPPVKPQIIIDTSILTIDDAVKKIYETVKEKISK